MTKRKTVIRLSVRGLVEFLLKSGDLDRSRNQTDPEAMLLGSRFHKKLQEAQDQYRYRKEVPLSYTEEEENFDLEITGRADGILEGDVLTIHEIKGVFFSLEKLIEPVPVHLAQAKVYAAIYLLQHDLKQIGIRMTYGNLETETIKEFEDIYERDEVLQWFADLLVDYKPWASFLVSWRKKRNESAKEISFPYDYRDGQKRTAAAVYHTISEGKKLFLQAPTGVGKTIATCFPGVKAIGEERIDRIFYLTARTTTQGVAEHTFSILRDKGLSLKSVVLTAKEKVCVLDEVNCHPETCPHAKGHFDRINDAVYDLITNEDHLSREVILQYAKKHMVCPFEMTLDAAEWLDVVICDYNYVFDPNTKLRRFFAEGNKDRYLFLIDEAHNLVDRGRTMFSASLGKESFKTMRKKIRKINPKIAKRLSACIRDFNTLEQDCETVREYNGFGNFIIHLMNLSGAIQEELEIAQKNEVYEELLTFFFSIRDFLMVAELVGDDYILYGEQRQDGFYLNEYCADPSTSLRQVMAKGAATILFSATLLPIRYYKDLLGADEDDFAIYAESPFDPSHRLVLLGQDVTTKYTMRSDAMYHSYATYLFQAMTRRKGHYMAFFPSYQFLTEVEQHFRTLCEISANPPEIMIQEPGMSEMEREDFLSRFRAVEEEESLLGFCVMGGIFSEGIDLTEDSLIGAFIVGTAIPQVSEERELLKNFFERRGEEGFDYAYRYEGMNRVLQAAGRVIRTDKDKGIVLLLDHRFSYREYKNMFPREWKRLQTCNLQNVSGQIAAFWDTMKQSGE